MHGTSVINGCVLGKQTSNSTQGHRALSSGDIIISSADKYELVMEENGNVIVDFESRKNNIREQLWEKENEIEKYIGLSLTPPNKKWDFPDEMSSFGNQVVEINLQGKTKRVVIPGKTEIGYDTNLLLQEVTAMCEKPTVYQGVVEKDFLSLPTFCTVGCMTKHQRYFPLWESEKSLHLKEGKLSQHYLFVADNKPKNDRGMIDGFNTVLRARLRDVDFYIREDKKLSLDSALEKLKDIVYHQKLGSQYQRVERLQNITANIAELMNLDEQQQHTLVNATKICKADLSTLMIGEYPEFEGMMAAEYCCQKTDSITGQPSDVYELVRWHNNYENSPLPLLPSENKFLKMGSVLILACQLEKLVGLFGIGEKPAGNKDPHGLRGAAAMIVNILTLTRYALPTDKLINIARNTFDKLPQFNISEIQNFIDGRLRAILLAEKPLLTTKEESQKKITKKTCSMRFFQHHNRC
jgi:glycyl-tRNA synthetase beta chain